ncbi:hypothetical protein ACOMHN_037144 [Nucella lapillus]
MESLTPLTPCVPPDLFAQSDGVSDPPDPPDLFAQSDGFSGSSVLPHLFAQSDGVPGSSDPPVSPPHLPRPTKQEAVPPVLESRGVFQSKWASVTQIT